jgi:hypothetical protein
MRSGLIEFSIILGISLENRAGLLARRTGTHTGLLLRSAGFFRVLNLHDDTDHSQAIHVVQEADRGVR